VSDDELARLQQGKTDIYANYGLWGAASLVQSCTDAAAEPLLDGRAKTALQAAKAYEDAMRLINDARTALADIHRSTVDGVWLGTARNAAADVVDVLSDDLNRAHDNYRALADKLHDYAQRLPPLQGNDETGQAVLSRARDLAQEQLWVATMPKLGGFGYDADRMYEAHQVAMNGIDLRADAHARAKEGGVQFASAMYDIAGQARSAALRSKNLTYADQLMLAGAGGDSPILTKAMDQRAADGLTALTAADQARLMALLAAAKSPEQRAYLMKALAAGYSMDEIAGFDAMIGPHGNDKTWLQQHLSPLQMDGTPFDGTRDVRSGDALWTQGDHPTCVPSSVIAARAQVDPLYALQLTTGGHPGDPGFDNPDAFGARLYQEQQQSYDETRDDRSWWDRQFNSEEDGLNDTEDRDLANAQITPHTGASYSTVSMADQQSRADTMPAVERAVDVGYPVPLSVHEEGEPGHALMVIGHSDGQLQIYNPWGATFWVSEQEFISGDIDADDPRMPNRPASVRLPQEAK
jgi:hypothetical protein